MPYTEEYKLFQTGTASNINVREEPNRIKLKVSRYLDSWDVTIDLVFDRKKDYGAFNTT